MFSASPAADHAQVPGMGARHALRESLVEGEDPHLQSNWDDGEGYYKARIGEVVGDRFQIMGVVGKGVFSTVLKCLDLNSGDGTQHVAVKMIRSNDTMRKAADKEVSILQDLARHDPHNKKFCVRLLSHLEYRNHVAMVFEFQQMNLREALKKFGKDVGINISAVRMYGRQLFCALRHLADLQVVHADLKLDNILCSADLKTVKLCDFGSAFKETDSDTDPTPYLVSRFYRAPEIVLGQQCKCHTSTPIFKPPPSTPLSTPLSPPLYTSLYSVYCALYYTSLSFAPFPCPFLSTR
ncbi:kinase-like domain-containing protein [Ochromonadaceae sp. CCMP2298]|nr:kinase-like domain-containing protein [Ochromonadaceae sp. CCMP2298]